MRAVRGAVVSSKPVPMAKAARAFSLFSASDASGLPADVGALVLCAAEAAAELHAFRRSERESRAGVGLDGEVGASRGREKRRKKRKTAEREAASLLSLE